jgi:Mg2+ and Co2+ transporter CorA
MEDILETVEEIENLKREVIYFMKLSNEAEKAIKRLRTSLNDETEQKLQLLDEVNKYRKKVPDLVLTLQLMIDLTRTHLINADSYAVVHKAKDMLENIS